MLSMFTVPPPIPSTHALSSQSDLISVISIWKLTYLTQKLDLNVGFPVMLLRNLNAPRLWNNTRFVVEALKQMSHRTHCKCQRRYRFRSSYSDHPWWLTTSQLALKTDFPMAIARYKAKLFIWSSCTWLTLGNSNQHTVHLIYIFFLVTKPIRRMGWRRIR